MEWELSKENVQPLKGGRNVEKLNASLKMKSSLPVEQLNSTLSQQFRIMVEAIDDYKGDDPIQPWLRCIQWIKEEYPSGGSQCGLIKVLELCARTFWKDEHYKDDIRYLKVWLEYADRCTEPRDIYSFLQDNEIGQGHALFYEACAGFWEHQKKYTKANEMYYIGIARKAQPLEKLQESYSNFFKRSAKEASFTEDVSANPSDRLQRSFGTNIGPLNVVGRSSGPLNRSQKTGPSSQRNNLDGKLPVFVDPKFRPGSSPSSFVPVDKYSASKPRNNTFLPSNAEKSKENTQLPAKWAGLKMPQRKAVVATPAPVIDVFTDEEFTKVDVGKEEGKKKVPASLFLRLDDIQDVKRTAERLRETPLMNFEDVGIP